MAFFVPSFPHATQHRHHVAMTARSPKPLEGVRVLDLSRLLPGPAASQALLEMGAEVDKLEDVQGGDYLRFMPPHHEGTNAPFQALNRGKRSLALDLKQGEGKAAFFTLLGRYDVLLEGFRPGVMDKLGLGAEALRAAHPRLIICSISGYGQRGPRAHRAGHDLNYLARAGILGLMGPARGAPQVLGVQLADVAGAMAAVQSILAALFLRERTGEGRVIDIAMCEAALPFAAFGLMSAAAGETVAAGQSALAGAIAPFSTYLTQDGRAMALAALEPKFWQAFCALVEIPCDLEALSPGPHQEALKAELAAIFAAKSFATWSALAAAHDVCLEPVLSPEEALADPELHARGSLATHAGLTTLRLASEGEPSLAAFPQQGADTRAILREAGLAPELIERLIASGVARQTAS